MCLEPALQMLVKVSYQQSSSPSSRTCGWLRICHLTTCKESFFKRKTVKEKKNRNRIHLWPWLSNLYLHTSCSHHALWVSLRTKGSVSFLCVTGMPAFLSTPSPSVTSTCDWQREQILEKWAIFPHGMFPQDCLFPGLEEKFPWQPSR